MLMSEWSTMDAAFRRDPTLLSLQCAFDAADYTGALKAAFALESTHPTHPGPLFHKARVHEALGQYETARTDYSRVIVMCSDQVRSIEAESAAEEPTWDSAVESAGRLTFARLEIHRMMDQSLLRTATTFDKERQRDRCLQELEAAFESRDRSVYLGAHLALLYLALGRKQDARQTCIECIETELFDADASDWRRLSEVLHDLGMHEEGAVAMRKAEQLNGE